MWLAVDLECRVIYFRPADGLSGMGRPSAVQVTVSLRKFWLTRPPVDVLAALVASLLKTKQESLAESICNLVNQHDGSIDGEPSSDAVRAEFCRALLTACAARGLHLGAEDPCLPIDIRDNFDMLDQGVEAEGKGGVEANELRLEEDDVHLDISAASTAENNSLVDDSHKYIRALRIGGQFVQALAIHAQLVEEGREESYALCKELMLLHASMGNVTEVDQVVEKMERNGFMEGSHRYDTVVRVYVKLKRAEKLTDLVSRIASSNVSVQILSSILCLLQCAVVIDKVLQSSYRDSSELVNNTLVTSPDFEKLEVGLEVALHQHAETIATGGGRLLESIWAHGLPQSCVSWQADCWSLDLHGAHPLAAKVLLVRWMAATSQLRVQSNVTSDCEVITGWGKHSRMAGQSRVKQEVLQLLQIWESPFKVDSGNLGKVVARSWILNQWLGLEKVVERD